MARPAAGSARAVALRVLRDAGARDGTLADALAQPDAERLDERDRAFLHELVLGTLRRRGLLDHAIETLVARPLGRIGPGVLEVLRLGVYQLSFMRVAAHAAVSESVELVREVEPRAASLVNAALRRLQREGRPPEVDPAARPLEWLTSAGSLPRWLAERWLAQLGKERAIARARAFLAQPPTFFRVNPRRTDAAARLEAAGVVSRPTAVPDALELASGRLADALAGGLVYVQDAAAQMVARLAADEGRVLDACAAPGGKALLIADAGARQVVAGELSTRRLLTLERLRALWGASNVHVVAADAGRPPFRAPFDSVLLDAPCSGLGTLARHPDVRWRATPRDLARHARRQRALIEGVAPLVRPGGRLVYATCSLEPEENEEVVQSFLDGHAAFCPGELPPWAQPFAAGPFLRSEPGMPGGDGFFAALLRRCS